MSRRVPCLCKLAPNTQKYSVQECGRAGGILGILNELNKNRFKTEKILSVELRQELGQSVLGLLFVGEKI